MEYFRTLNFFQEPFSNSPDPGLFYESRQHLYALQQLEIAIRLKRGLNAIIGDVGTGKTTLCRQLIQKITQDPSIENHLILDPSFATTTDFLNSILKFFSNARYLGCDDTNLKEEIKNHLFLKGVDQNKIVVLMIDEGQKLPEFCLEILRELLNYETNSQKLLQIVIFGQKELDQTIAPLENFADRINFKYELHPLDFKETKGLIKYRVKNSMEKGHRANLFSFFSYFALFHFTKGYPRKIIHLCHHALLALIVQDKSKAGYFFIRSCALNAGNPKKISIGALPAVVAALIVFCSIYFFNFPDISKIFPEPPPATEQFANQASPASMDHTAAAQTPVTKPETEPVAKPGKAPALAAAPARTLQAPAPVQQNQRLPSITQTASPVAAAPPLAKPSILPDVYGTIHVPGNETLSKISEHIYGTFNPEKLSLILDHNPSIIDPHVLTKGMPLTFPAVSDFLNSWDLDDYCIVLSQQNTFSFAYQAARKLENRKYTVRVLPVFVPDMNTFTYYIVINRPYNTLSAATAFKEKHVQIHQAFCTVISSIITNPKQRSPQITAQRNPL